MPSNYRLKLTARLFLGERPQLKRSVGLTNNGLKVCDVEDPNLLMFKP
jgi:hypothetical protein